MSGHGVTHVKKACAYITRDDAELLVFEGPEHDGLQIPKGTVEPGERPREAVYREAIEESGLAAFEAPRHLTTDVWTRRAGRRYVRSFYHARVHEPRDAWTHTVTGAGEERGTEYEFFWVDLPASEPFALDLDDHLGLLPVRGGGESSVGVAAD
ncbi:MAG: NUDIX domain-containing protein [Haloferacaceae archaeon]